VSTSVKVEIEVPEDLARLHLPEGVDRRLQALLDKQDGGTPLTPDEQAEAEGLVDLADLLTLLSLRVSQGHAGIWMSGGQVPISLQRRVRLRAGERCEYCRIAQASQDATFHTDHVVPRVAGGTTSFENLALACVSCSLRKGARTTAIDRAIGDVTELFHPRIHTWTDHFRADESGEIIGLTAIGRGTVVSLSMNRVLAVRIRREERTRERWP
jgi:hypothetical protein